MSRATFLQLVDEKRLPQPKRLKGLVFWDRLELDAFVEFYDGDAEKPGNSIDNLLGISK